MSLALAPLRRCLTLALIGAGLVAGHLTLTGSEPAGAGQNQVSAAKAPLPRARIATGSRPRYVVASLPDTLAR